MLCCDNLHYAHHGPAAEKQSLCPWSGSVRVLGLYLGMEQICRAGAIQRLSCPWDILPGTVAIIHKIYTLSA